MSIVLGRRHVLAAVSACSLLWSAIAGASAGDRFESIRQAIRDGMQEQNIPSYAVAVAQDGKIVWEEAFGWADRERRIPATVNTIYSLASVSKPMTGTALMTLVQAGKIDLDRPINDYLGAAKLRARVGDVNQATVRRVANHTAGLPMHWQFFYADEPYQQPSLDETILHYGNIVTPPAERFTYTNLGTGLLNGIIERTSGMSFADYMRQEVFLPLGMTRSSVDIAPSLQEFVAARYGSDDLPLPFFSANHAGASGIYSSVHDVLRFGLFHLKTHRSDQKAILSDASLDEMHRRTAERGADFGYGVGFEVSTVAGRRWVHHSGGMDGASTIMVLLPDQNIAVVVLANKRGMRGDIPEMILSTLLHSNPPAKKPVVAKAESVCSMASTLSGVWQGTLATYEGDRSLELRFVSADEVQVRLGDQLPTLLNRPNCDGNSFSGEFLGRIGTADTDRYRYRISVSLHLRGAALNGTATAIHVEGRRGPAALAHWVEVRRIDTTPAHALTSASY
ncbi:serine hydrolase domain-containing protein [Steroidobacter sp.]|uniref:serine hydrolase domain-containing protein n=1 Tax=Steroidobacter sp. TaxID=1978227 RepID=UPI001A57E866|nr:serine hydrolase domain-containing protein [Steroidobacter sp.]MBL8271683.1 beta-lactamase family protein [Steroidobacter sp.]